MSNNISMCNNYTFVIICIIRVIRPSEELIYKPTIICIILVKIEFQGKKVISMTVIWFAFTEAEPLMPTRYSLVLQNNVNNIIPPILNTNIKLFSSR